MLVVGDKEVENNTVSVRSRRGAEVVSMGVDEFISLAVNEINSKEIK